MGAPSIDLSYLESMPGLAPDAQAELIRKIIRIFRENSPGIIASIATAIDERQYELAGRAAHKLKSSCLNIGAKPLASLLAEVESPAEGRTDDEWREAARKIRAEHEAVERELALR